MKKGPLLVLSQILVPLFIAGSIAAMLSCSPPGHNYLDTVFELSFAPEDSEANVVNLINQADISIYVALYGFENDAIADALVDAHRRGVRIRLVSEYDSESEEGWQRMIENDIPLVLDNTGGIMHNKYFIVDMKYVLTGSTNLTAGMEIHFNNMILIKSTALAMDFKRDFDILYNGYSASNKDDGLLALFGTSVWPETVHQIGAYQIQAFFTPYRKSFPSYQYSTGGVDYTFYNYDDQAVQTSNYKNALNVIIPLLQNAQYQIYVLTFAFTDRVIASELIKAYTERAVDVRLWMDYNMYASQFRYSGATYSALRDILGPDRAKICRQADGGLLHHKVLIIDNAVILGSLNFSNSAVTSNDENFLVIHNAGPLIGMFKQEAARVDLESHPIPY